MSVTFSDDDEINAAIIGAALASTVSAQPDSSPNQPTLAELHALVSGAAVAPSLDALNLLSVLLPCKDPAARDLVTLIGDRCSAKEVIMAAQEATERMAEHAQAEDDDDNESELKTSQPEQLNIILMLYQAVIPRITLRRRSAPEMLEPLLLDLRRAMEVVSDHASTREARSLMEIAGSMARKVLNWARESPGTGDEELTRCQSLLKCFLDTALLLFRHAINNNVAQRAFETCFPRLRATARPQSLDDEEWRFIHEYTLIYVDLGYKLNEFTNQPSISSVVLLVHSWLSSSLPPQPQLLLSFTPSILMMLQPTSTLQGDGLAFLMLALHANKITTGTELSPDTINAFTPPLVALSSMDPGPQTRHQAFRVLSLLAASGPSQLRLHLLADLVANCEFPQMRVAAVGLVKDAVLEALAPSPPYPRNVFGTPMFMKVFGPILFRPNPPDLFEFWTKPDCEEFLEGPEAKKIVEVLSLYYVILMRDKDNITGIRDRDMLDNVEKNMLSPLRRWLEEVSGEGVIDNDEHTMMPLVALRMGLNRAEEARKHL